MKKTLSTMIILFLAVGFVWASEKSPAEQPDQVEAAVVEEATQELQELDAGTLALEDPALVPMAGGCCQVECGQQKTACRNQCGGSSACLEACNLAWIECLSNC